MKKKLFVTILALIMVLSLAACGECQHEWTEADCLNAAVCTKCEEVGEAALGHDFAPATCTDPETCTRCGEAQGEALGHDFTDWTFTKTEKSRACTRCDQTESEEIDEETYARHLMNGHWDTYIMVIDGKQYTSYDLAEDAVPQYLDITDTGMIYSTDTGIYEMTLEYQEYDESFGWYLFTGNFDDGGVVPVVLTESETQNTLTFILDANTIIEFSKYEQEKAVTAATWVCTTNGTVYSINLEKDGTFTADLGEEITGIWQMLPTTTGYSSHVGKCTLSYKKDGQRIVINGQFYYAYGEELNWEDALYSTSLSMTPNEEIGYLNFSRLQNADDLESLKTAMAEGKEEAIGSWTSKTLQIDSQDNYTTESYTDHTLTINADGTFTLMLEEERSGTWTFNHAYVSNGYTSYEYDVQLDNSDDYNDVNMRLNSDGNLSFTIYKDESSYFYTFAQLTEEEKALLLKGPELLIGEYVSVSVQQEGSAEHTPETGYTMTVNADGTFTANVGDTLTGTWYFEDISERGLDYLFQIDGFDSGLICPLSDETMLYFFYPSGSGYIGINFQKQ